MREVVKDRSIVMFYIITMLVTYLLVVNVDVLNENVTDQDLRIVYKG